MRLIRTRSQENQPNVVELRADETGNIIYFSGVVHGKDASNLIEKIFAYNILESKGYIVEVGDG